MATWVLAELVPATHVRDAIALADFTRLNHPLVEAPASALLLLLDPPFYAVWAVAITAVGLRRRVPRVALGAGALMLFAPFSAELLKPLLAHPHAHAGAVYIAPASWPSGHATAATSLAWAAWLVAPPASRRQVALAGAGLALAVGCCLLVLAWHMPSDVLGGYLLATLWALVLYLALQALGRSDRFAGSEAPGPSDGFAGSEALARSAWEPGSHSDSAPSLAARARMNSMSESRFR